MLLPLLLLALPHQPPPHWAFVPPRRPPVPMVQGARNPIDAFICRRLDREGLRPSPETDRATLIRRVTLDLTGLPPTPAEVDAFLNDQSPDAYEKVVDRLLASPRYGERMACAGSTPPATPTPTATRPTASAIMWRWRDWVIDAYNRNMPFDQFTDRATRRRPAAERRRSTSASPPASTATTAATPRAGSSPRSTRSSTSSIAWTRRRRCGSA